VQRGAKPPNAGTPVRRPPAQWSPWPRGSLGAVGARSAQSVPAGVRSGIAHDDPAELSALPCDGTGHTHHRRAGSALAVLSCYHSYDMSTPQTRSGSPPSSRRSLQAKVCTSHTTGCLWRWSDYLLMALQSAAPLKVGNRRRSPSRRLNSTQASRLPLDQPLTGRRCQSS